MSYREFSLFLDESELASSVYLIVHLIQILLRLLAFHECLSLKRGKTVCAFSIIDPIVYARILISLKSLSTGTNNVLLDCR